MTRGISFLSVGEVGVVGVKLEGVLGSSGEGLGADVVGAKLEGVEGSSGEGLEADVVEAKLEGVVGSLGKELEADVVGDGLEGVVGSSAGGIGSFSEDCVMLIEVWFSSKSSLGNKSPPFGTPGIY